ncbi:MAG: penicillin-binding protein [Proteobacteria bacterium]|nr:penicillin-binding protein [Pseudomonadota bacterium]
MRKNFSPQRRKGHEGPQRKPFPPHRTLLFPSRPLRLCAFAVKYLSFGLLLVLIFSANQAHALPTFPEVKKAYTESDAWLLARDGRPLQSRRIDFKERRLPWTRIEDTSPAFLRALLVSEDRNFYQHGGVDWGAVASSAWRNLWRGRTRGASTLSMQLVGLLDEEDRRQGRRSVTQKLSQASGALWLERHWKKDEILEAYLNLVSFRGEQVGVAAMSRGLFGKWPDGLDEREAAISAALLRAPAASPAVVANRACTVLQGMAELSRRPAGSCEGLDALARLALAGGMKADIAGTSDPTAKLAPHLAQKLLSSPGERLKSTLDADLQAFANSTLTRHLRELARQNAEDGAVLVVDNASGDILAWVGSSGSLSQAAQVDGIVALRQAGSTLKPFLYALALEKRALTAASLLDDSPLALSTSNGLYVPQNYTSQYRGWVSARMALGGSLNIPAVRTLLRLGPDAFHRQLQQFGFASLTESAEYYGYSLALGSADISLLMQANAYRTLANGGRWSPLKATPDASKKPCTSGGCAGVFDGKTHAATLPQASFIVADILADRSARAATFGLESWLATPYWSAVKTGTSKDMRDNWCAGFSRRYTVAVWVGNAAGEAMHDVSGVSGAAPIWREVMDWLQRGESKSLRKRIASTPPSAPAGVIRQLVRFEPPSEPQRQEWFLVGSAMSVIKLATPKALAHIAYPGEGSIIALDPDIPPGRQRIALQLSSKAGEGWRWQLDGKTIGTADQLRHWLPQPGKHRLALIDAANREIEFVQFEVRAMRGKKKR